MEIKATITETGIFLPNMLIKKETKENTKNRKEKDIVIYQRTEKNVNSAKVQRIHYPFVEIAKWHCFN